MRKKLLLATFATLSFAAANADSNEFPYLMFQTTDGNTSVMASAGLIITFSDGNLIATNSDGSKTIALSELSKMFFATESTGMKEIQENLADEPIEIYTLAGISLGKYENIEQAQNTLNKGVYVVKSASGTHKIAVK